MSVVTIIGAGMMGSALAFPARENGHEVRLVGTHLDREIIDECIKTGRHPKFSVSFPSGLKYYQIEKMEQAIDGADVIIGGVSSFGVNWFADFVLPKIPDTIPLLTVTKGLVDTADGKLICYPDVWQKNSMSWEAKFLLMQSAARAQAMNWLHMTKQKLHFAVKIQIYSENLKI